MVLVAVLPPDHILRHAYRAQDELFRRYGLASTRALPPIIPVGRIDAFDQETPPNALTADRWMFPPFQIGAVSARDGHLTAETTLAEACAQLAVTLALDHPVEAARRGEPALPPGRLFLGETESTESPEVPEAPLGPEALCSGLIRSASLIHIEIETDPSRIRWWHAVRWCITATGKLRATQTA